MPLIIAYAPCLVSQLIYVGSAESDQHDQQLDQVLVGPMQVRTVPRD